MQRNYWSTVSIALLLFMSVSEVFAEDGRADKYLQSGQQAADSGDWYKAEASFLKAVKELESAGNTNNQTYATALKRLAQSCRHNQKYGEAGQYLNKAIATCKAIGSGDPEVNSEFFELSKDCKIVDLDKLGPGSANTLKGNSAVITILKSGGSYAVTIALPQRFEKTLNSDKIDQMGLEKECTFKIVEDADGTVRATEIKGFKIHSVEKNMWVNLLGCSFGPANAQGHHESIISAGKMGVVKNVNSTIAPKTYEPVGGIIASIHEMGQPVVPPLVIADTPSPATMTNPMAASPVESPVSTTPAPSSPVESPVSTTPAPASPVESPVSKTQTPTSADDLSSTRLDKAARQAAAQAALEKAGEEKEAAEREAARTVLRNAGKSKRDAAVSGNVGTDDLKRSNGVVEEKAQENLKREEENESRRATESERNKDEDDDEEDKRRRLERKERKERERQLERERDAHRHQLEREREESSERERD